MPEPALIADRLSIWRPPATDALPADVSLQVAPGEVLLVLGPSGCGKSTLALALNGLIPAAVPAQLSGSIRIGGLESQTATVAELSRIVGMVFQDPDAQIVTSRVFDEVCFAPENHLIAIDEIENLAEQALRAVGLWQLRDARPDRLSGGQRQRLAIACAIAMRPALLVLDEPTANLDTRGVDDVYRALRTLVSSTNSAVVLIEHNLDAAIDIVDRVVVLDKSGRVACSGPTTEVLAERAVELQQLGVWLPTATMAALRLRNCGVAIEALPLSAPQLRCVLEGAPKLPDPVREQPRPAPLDPVVLVSDLHVKRGRRTVLNGLNLTLGRGELLAVLGSNGAGKSTLLHVLGGLGRRRRRSEIRGTVRIAGHDPARLSAAALTGTIGFVFQNPEHQLVSHTVEDELAQSLRILRPRPSDEQINARVERMLQRLGLTHLRHRHPFLLSGGQKRRLSVGTALIAGAEVLVLDEPTYGQDREHATALMSMLEELRAQGATIIMATHDLQLVAEHATRVAILDGGVLTAHGPSADILHSDKLAAAGHVTPPLASATKDLANHRAWRTVTRLRDIPEGAG